MKRLFLFCLVGALCLLMFSATAFAGGFAVYEWSARGDALGGAMIARADDPSAIVYNPAGITQLEGTQVLTGMAWLSPRGEVKFKSTGNSTEAKELKHFVPHGYATFQYSDRVTFGVGAYTRFGLANEFDQGWEGSFDNYKASLHTYTVAPTAAIKLTDDLSFGLSLELVRGSADIRNSPTTNSTAKLSGQGFGVGIGIGTHYAPADWISFGAKFNSPVELKIDGSLEISDFPVNSLNGSHSGYARLRLPGSAAFGVMVKPTEKLSVEVDAIRTFWSSYGELDPQLDNPVIEGAFGGAKEKAWSDVWRFQIGAEYALTDSIDLRAGYVYDEAPNGNHADFMMFPGDRQIFFGGFGYKINGWRFDASYGYLMGEEVDASVRTGSTTYSDVTFQDINAHLMNFSISYAF